MDDASRTDSAAILVHLDEERRKRNPDPVHFNRQELDAVLHVYSMMVGAGAWRDYRIDSLRDKAVFSVYRRASEMALYRIEKIPGLARKQGQYAVIAADGSIQKRGNDLGVLLKVFDKPLRLAIAKRDGRLR